MWEVISPIHECSDEGIIRNIKTKKTIKQFLGNDGYMRVQICGKTMTVHRIVAYYFVEFVEGSGRTFVNHIDGNKQNNKASNLEWCTRSENMKHAYRLGLKSSIGTKNSRCKLSEKDVTFIKEHYIPRDKYYGATALSQKFDVSRQTITAVTTGQNWRYQDE